MAIINVFHGSPYHFSEFKGSPAGIHFGTRDQAAHAATLKLGRIPLRDFERLQEVKGWRGKIYSCSILVNNTKRIKDPRTASAWSRQIKKAISEGFDSIIYTNDFEGGEPESSYCIFSPTQVINLQLEN